MPVSMNGAEGRDASPATRSERPLQQALLRGAMGRCPACGAGRMFSSYLKVVASCPHCGEDLHHQRADDAPAYFTMVIVGHVVVAGVLMMERAFVPPTWVQLSVWLPMTLVLSLALLPVVKGMLVALQWALRMHGFGTGRDPAAPDPDPAAEIVHAAGGRAS
ncbi:MAG: DUF983 domain-containing protein [Hyphomicrobiaceae bacterium]